MDVVTAALEHVEHGAVEVPVLLAIGAGRIAFDVGLDRLHHIGGLRAHHVLAVERRPALPNSLRNMVRLDLAEYGTLSRLLILAPLARRRSHG